MNEPALLDDTFMAADGAKLPLRVWMPSQEAKVVLIGVHGFNDYGNFLNPGFPQFLNSQGIKLITYDQRGFGATPNRGLWAGGETLKRDLATLIRLVKDQHPGIPLYVLGESMGGAVVLTTHVAFKDLPVDGMILSAPAVWGMSTWPWYQKLGLNIFSKIAPGLKLSGGGIVQPTDHLQTWESWSRDPLVIRGTRIDALLGVSRLMEEALGSAPDITLPTLVLYGAKDQIIPLKPVQKFARALPAGVKLAYYPEGWHMLPRDHNGPVVWKDITSWIINGRDAPLPSGEDSDARIRLDQASKAD